MSNDKLLALTNNPFLSQVYMHIRSLKPIQYAALKRRKAPAWMYPFKTEMMLKNFIGGILNDWVRITEVSILPNIEKWLNENKTRFDAWEDEKDNAEKEMDSLQDYWFKGVGYTILVNKLRQLFWDVQTFNEKEFVKVINHISGVTPNIFENFLPAMEKRWINDNVSLIRNISDDYRKKISMVISNGVSNDKNMVGIRKEIESLNTEIQGSRAKLVARDQVGKINGQMQKRKQENIGISWYTWETSIDERVVGNPNGLYPIGNKKHGDHWALEGKICDWADDTIYADTIQDAMKGDWKKRTTQMPKTIPGVEIQCRCFATPIMLDMLEGLAA